MRRTLVKSLGRSKGKLLAAVAAAAALSFTAVGARADTVNLGAASNFAVLGFNSLNDDFSLVTVNGNVGVADTSNLKIMAPSKVNGNVLVGSSATFSDSNPGNVSGSVLTNQNLSAAVTDAKAAFNLYTGLAATQTFSGISSQTTITGNGGTSVIDINGSVSKGITFNGGPNDLFVVNISGGGITLGGSDSILAGSGIKPNQIVINIEGTGDVNTHVGNVIDGTVIDPGGSGNLDGAFNGRLFFGGSSLTLLSGAVVTATPVPLPAPLAQGGALFGCMGVAALVRKKIAAVV